MYPDFAKIAREEGFTDIALLFDNIAKIEQDHELRFMSALMSLNKEAKKEEVQASLPPKKKTVEVQGYRCAFCGAIYDERPDVCGVCGAIGSFEQTTYQKEI